MDAEPWHTFGRRSGDIIIRRRDPSYRIRFTRSA